MWGAYWESVGLLLTAQRNTFPRTVSKDLPDYTESQKIAVSIATTIRTSNSNPLQDG
jgi:hypothetical protein